MSTRIAVVALTFAILCGAVRPVPGAAQAQGDDASAHVAEIVSGSADTPNGEGLLPIAIAEVETARRQVQLSLVENDLSSLDEIQIHNRNAMHALDPAREPEGPGPGYGLISALDRIAEHAALAADDDDAPAPVRERAADVGQLAGDAAEDARELLQGTVVIEGADDTAEVRALVPQMLSASEELVRDVAVLEDAVARLAEAAGIR